ncbi:SRP9 domain [Dillenia turbinata]|uniref:Signal recognition particle 9 kDa protein n=1 Tax=Dillenia turbinata TaxID=194707 RepID=A0AAN8VP31_9MAGN
MVYIESWDEFVERSIQLYRADPHSTRYVTKYRHCDGKLVLKVTDNREGCAIPSYAVNDQPTFVLSCLKFKTDQAQDAKKMEKLNNIFFTLMVRGPEADISEVTGKEQMDAQPSKKGRGRKQ